MVKNSQNRTCTVGNYQILDFEVPLAFSPFSFSSLGRCGSVRILFFRIVPLGAVYTVLYVVIPASGVLRRASGEKTDSTCPICSDMWRNIRSYTPNSHARLWARHCNTQQQQCEEHSIKMFLLMSSRKYVGMPMSGCLVSLVTSRRSWSLRHHLNYSTCRYFFEHGLSPEQIVSTRTAWRSLTESMTVGRWSRYRWEFADPWWGRDWSYDMIVGNT